VVASFKTSLVMRPYEFGRQLVVMEHPIPFEQYKFLTNEISLKGCHCEDKGKTKLEVEFAKNVFFSNEKVAARVKIDNTGCGVPVERVYITLKQKLYLRVPNAGKEYRESFDIHTKNENVYLDENNPIFDR
jgi:hypothetical protein